MVAKTISEGGFGTNGDELSIAVTPTIQVQVHWTLIWPGKFKDDATRMINKIKNILQGLFKEYLKLNDNIVDPIS